MRESGGKWATRGVVAVVVFLGALVVTIWHREGYEIFRNAALLTNAPPLPDRQSWPTSDDDSPCGRLLLGTHRPVPGERTVMVVQKHYHGGLLAPVDAVYFEALSLEIRDPKIEETITIPSPRVRVFYSSGNRIWVDNCSGRFGTEATGTVTLATVAGIFIRAEIDLTVTTEVAAVNAASGPTRSSVRFRDAGWYW